MYHHQPFFLLSALLILPAAILDLHLVRVVLGQEPRRVHPWRTECQSNGGCFVGYFCSSVSDLCERCPAAAGADDDDDGGSGAGSSRTLPTDCERLGLSGNDTAITSGNDTTISSASTTTSSTVVEDCRAGCVRAQVGDACSAEVVCQEGVAFCNYFEEDDNGNDNGSDDDTSASTSASSRSRRIGTCQRCKRNVAECITDASISSDLGLEECILCDLRVCVPLHFSVVQVQVQIEGEGGEVQTIASNAMQGSPSLFVSAPLVDCTNLIHDDEVTCSSSSSTDDDGGSDGATGRICLVNDYTKNTLYIAVVRKCTILGGVGVIFYGDYSPRTPNNTPWTGSLGYDSEMPDIPSVSVSYDDGMRLAEELEEEEEKEGTGTVVLRINTTDVGEACIKRQFCSEDVPCSGSSADRYCDYKWSGGTEGFCRDCPVDDEDNPDPRPCFFSIQDWGAVTPDKAVVSCSQQCEASLTFPDCKFCPADITGFNIDLTEEEGGGEEGEEQEQERCEFCPGNDVLYPDKEFPLFGNGIMCWQVQKAFKTVAISKQSTNCLLAQMYNYVCGCSGSGYSGASTTTKQAVLVWLPRMMAILSFLGSSFIVYDVSKSKKRREKLQNQLLVGLSIFDLFGSTAYALTTLPIPADYGFGPIYGAKGTSATCTAQGYFIQLGSTAAYMNTSLAFYYLLVIKYGWSEIRIKRIRWALFLVPILIGLAFAFASIPYNEPLALWCNNAASYWPEIPMIVTIGLATIVMGIVCWDVSSKERATKKYRTGDTGRPSLSRKVFWQSFFYLMAFYIVWPVYLALQFAWASGYAFTNYGFILAAGTMVPLQGFWNMLVYIRPRHFDKAAKQFTSTMATLTSSFLMRRKNSRDSRHSSTDPVKKDLANIQELDVQETTCVSASDGK
mmetsp:Transcript_16015/g.34843  ORF Transcript_16015/g.34843 Transcript_16015/m.34843 type:complete len:900 (-) Transcript_16015:27-2726(-)|eukprot:CAMPEP_0178478264 /NCGR_PEP_ID=MMETSP0696-20121128/4570_1 /TAXON_ID=265572 /ORGANISM="Extubocellulus spinifer, Strain CCMP396" /LENGTH=899 /DNA_ID=CAMNT_0020105627 /DNA_START=95 /DNA_END=2794 /DNA_ORIENTATION=+